MKPPKVSTIKPSDDDQFSRKRLAKRWAVTTKTVKRRERAGLIRSIKMGRSIRYRLSDILAAEEYGF